MVEKLKLQDFDILGILELKDIQGIEKFVNKRMFKKKLCYIRKHA